MKEDMVSCDSSYGPMQENKTHILNYECRLLGKVVRCSEDDDN